MVNHVNLYNKVFLFVALINFMLCGSDDIRAQSTPRVIVLTDINIAKGDPDDRQSLIHLLWYSNELDIRAIVPDRWDAGGYEACILALEAYEKDYVNYNFKSKEMPLPKNLKEKIIPSEADAIDQIKFEAEQSGSPLYILVWGNMLILKKFLFLYPDLVDNCRVLTIGTGRKYGPKDDVPGKDCAVANWNAKGRDEIYNDSRFDRMWWVESNWTYNGMFQGKGPREMFEKLQKYGALGRHIKEVTKHHPWAQYFRVGDTPTVTYLLDYTHDVNHPEMDSWAGKFKKPFPTKRPNYYTDDNGLVDWDYSNPCKTWDNIEEMYKYNMSTLLSNRSRMYDALLSKLNTLYSQP